MKDPNIFTVTALKEKLRQMKLSTSGNKAELILRLNQADPTGQWIYDLDGNTGRGSWKRHDRGKCRDGCSRTEIVT